MKTSKPSNKPSNAPSKPSNKPSNAPSKNSNEPSKHSTKSNKPTTKASEPTTKLSNASKKSSIPPISNSRFKPGSGNASASIKPSTKVGHVYVIHCGVDGLACDTVLHNLGNTDKLGEIVLDESESGLSLTRVYRANFLKAKKPEDEMVIHSNYLDIAAEFYTGKQSAHKRAKPLIGLKLMDIFEADSSVRRDLMKKCYNIVMKYNVDVALCVSMLSIYKTTLKIRYNLCPFIDGPFWMINESQMKEIDKLIHSLRAGRLNVFMGAGISMPSGAPSWGNLLKELAVVAGYSKEEREYLARLDFLDQPTIFEEDMGADFKKGIAEIILRTSRFTPVHALIRTLQCPCVTTNYDRLYEQAGESVGEIIRQLPWDMHEIKETDSKRTSLLKLHGCVDHTDAIILSRKDYMRYPDNNQALRGRLQGMFLTSDILFAGFSMTDNNVHKIIDDVRKVSYVNDQPVEGRKLGTILTMTYNTMFNRLWDQDFEIVWFGKSWNDNPTWFHDCFLDCLACAHVMSTND